jgi:hypothetical protein
VGQASPSRRGRNRLLARILHIVIEQESVATSYHASVGDNGADAFEAQQECLTGNIIVPPEPPPFQGSR